MDTGINMLGQFQGESGLDGCEARRGLESFGRFASNGEGLQGLGEAREESGECGDSYNDYLNVSGLNISPVGYFKKLDQKDLKNEKKIPMYQKWKQQTGTMGPGPYNEYRKTVSNAYKERTAYGVIQPESRPETEPRESETVLDEVDVESLNDGLFEKNIDNFYL